MPNTINTIVPDPKIVDLFAQHPTAFTSLEYFPPRTDEGVLNLKARIHRMKSRTSPVFADVTWGAGGSTSELTMDLVDYVKNAAGVVANMHLTCTNQNPDLVKEALDAAREKGIRNIVALRGDPPHGESDWKDQEGGFNCALDLVKFIKANYGDAFGISVAGYPEGHPVAITEVRECDLPNLSPKEKLRVSKSLDKEGKMQYFVCRDGDYKKEMVYLKEKIDAGADFIITQMFFDSNVYVQFLKDCEDYGINVKVVPGIMCINNVGGFNRMTGFCKTRVPDDLAASLERIKDDEEAVKKFGVEFGVKLCKELVAAGAPCVHFYTLNLERVVYGILDGLGWAKGISNEVDESDAKTMQAKGSSWARVGDSVTSIYGSGVVKECRSDGSAVIDLESWKLAGGQIVTASLAQGAYSKQ